MTDLASFPDLLAEYFEIPAEQLDSKAVSDPRRSVRVDVDTIVNTLRGPERAATPTPTGWKRS